MVVVRRMRKRSSRRRKRWRTRFDSNSRGRGRRRMTRINSINRGKSNGSKIRLWRTKRV